MVLALLSSLCPRSGVQCWEFWSYGEAPGLLSPAPRSLQSWTLTYSAGAHASSSWWTSSEKASASGLAQPQQARPR